MDATKNTVSDEPKMHDAHIEIYESTPYLLKISVSEASEPLPEKGFKSIRLVSSGGIENSLNTGERIFKNIPLKPLVSKSCTITNTANKYGNSDVQSGIACFAPSIKAEYTLTLFTIAKTKTAIKKTGII